MKRTELKRTAPLKTSTPLKRTPLKADPETTRAWQKRTRKPLPQKSARQIKRDALYTKQRAAHLEANPWCLPCYNIFARRTPATTIHHMAKRGVRTNDETTFLSCCMDCHRWIEEHPAEAKTLGFSVSLLELDKNGANENDT